MDHFACLRALREAGVEENVVLVVHSFLYGRKMAVHVGDIASKFMYAPGGAPQGSVLGSFLFCSTTASLAKKKDHDVTANFSENGQSVSDIEEEVNRPELELSPISAPFRPSTPPSLGQLDIESDSDDELVDLGMRRPSQRLLDSTVGSERMSESFIEEALNLPPFVKTPPTVKAYIDDYNIIEKVRVDSAISHFTTQRPSYEVHAPQSENMFGTVKENAKDIGMVVNDEKTQLICIQSRRSNVSSYIRTGEKKEIIERSSNSLKILGFTFGSTPDASTNTDIMIRKFSSRLWALRFLKRAGLTQADLIFLYKSILRPSIEFAAVVYHSLLTKTQSQNIERMQMRAMKVIFGDLVSYNTVIESGAVEPLYVRRESSFKKFAIKTSKHERFAAKWLERNDMPDMELRRREKYLIPRYRTERANKSPIIQIRRVLNSL